MKIDSMGGREAKIEATEDIAVVTVLGLGAAVIDLAYSPQSSSSLSRSSTIVC